ncbi:hypothetical protein [Emcibacter sp. SYSU 3D8]|uniref:hypothetical protein n=1 Tax=Emcibacter sp. SYSU 3D8 TaxID=3133969 RepID=UPI0031FF1BF7
MNQKSEPATNRPEPMASNRPGRRTVTTVAVIVLALVLAIAAAMLLGVFGSPAWTQS